ncbi:MAG: heme lyase CcmF/NrfE family subunit [Pseudomonadota bacterium]
MDVEFGHFALVLAFVIACLQMAAPAWPVLVNGERAQRMDNFVQMCATLQFALVALAFAVLTAAYVGSDFSVQNVYLNSHTEKPLFYKFTGVWANHEGSLLLWVLMLALFGALVAWRGQNLEPGFRTVAIAVQGALGAAFLAFMLFTSNPFERLFPVPLEGQGLNPVLQDPALAIHPPMLYVGYVGFSVAFSFAVAALIVGRIDAVWARWVRPWTLVAWVFLTIGIALGSWWAYYELGWGGWWFWDPVENASFMPWLAGTAMLHSALVMERRETLKAWTILLAIITFALCLLGAFIVRSGVLTSVHAFAVDPERGVFILAILLAATGGAFALFAWRAPLFPGGRLFAPVSREGALVLNNMLLLVSGASVLVGTLYPLALEGLTGAKLSVGPPYFDLAFGAIMVPLLIAVPFGAMLAWRNGDLLAVGQRLYVAAGVALLAAIAVGAATTSGPWLSLLGIALAAWVIMGAMTEWATRTKLFAVPLAETWRRSRGLPRGAYASMMGHLGLGICTLGIVATSAFQVEQIHALKPGEQVPFLGRTVVYDGTKTQRVDNFSETAATLRVMDGDTVEYVLRPAKREFVSPPMITTEAGIEVRGLSDVYANIGDETSTGARVVRLYYNPLVQLIWIGAYIMAFGGLLALLDRRLRFGTVKVRNRQPGGTSPGAAPVPAE